MEQSREKFASRLGFILISAGCAIGLGNVYRFPIITGAYGGGVFVLIYIAFLVLLGLPIMSAELAVGRGSQRSIASSFDVLEKKGQKWHLMKYLGICGNYLLMMFYTVISGWMVIYFVKYLTGSIMSASGVEGLSAVFGNMVSDPGLMVVSAFAVILICFGICSMGLQKGVEGITKWMMVALLALMIGLAVYSATLPNAAEGLRFYLVPSLKRLEEAGVSTVISAAMGQSFFTLSLGIGAIAIFGSYIGKEQSLLGESANVIVLDTFVAIVAGLIMFPACYTYGLEVNAGPSLLFVTLPTILQDIPLGRLFAIILYVAMIFAGVSSLQNMFEAVAESLMHKFPRLSRTAVLVILCVVCLGFGIGMETIDKWGPWMDLVSIYIIPIGATLGAISWFYVMKKDELLDAVNTGSGKLRGNLWYSVGRYVYVPLAVILCCVALFMHVAF